MAIYKCKMCGGTIEFEKGDTVGVCDSCGTKQTLPKTNNDVISNLFNRANNLRLKCEFDKSAQIYEKIIEQDDSEAEAHWGIVLCKYGIEYVEDPKTFKRIPTCHRTLFEAVTTDADYLAAIDYSDDAQQYIYESEARAIDRIQKDILAIVKNEKPFDVFTCYKETDENGKRTIDSTITLEDKLGQEYEPYIVAAEKAEQERIAEKERQKRSELDEPVNLDSEEYYDVVCPNCKEELSYLPGRRMKIPTCSVRSVISNLKLVLEVIDNGNF